MDIQTMNRKGVQFKDALFSIIIFSVIIIAVGVIISGSNNTYNSGLNYDLGELNKLDEVSRDSNTAKQKISPNDPDPGENAEANTFKGVYGILTNIFQSFNLVFGEEGMLGNVAERFGIPTYVVQMIVSFMIIGITFSLIGVIFRLGKPA